MDGWTGGLSNEGMLAYGVDGVRPLAGPSFHTHAFSLRQLKACPRVVRAVHWWWTIKQTS